MSTSIPKDGVYRLRIAGEALCAGINQSNQVLLEAPNESAATQKWNITLRGNTFTATSFSNAALKLTYDLDDPNDVSGNGFLIVSSTKNATLWSVRPKKGPPDYAEIHVTYPEQDPDVAGMVLDSQYKDKIVHFQQPRDNRKNQRWLFEFVQEQVTGPTPQATPVGTNVTDQFVPTGTYSLHNVKFGNVLDLPEGNIELEVGQPLFVDSGNTNKWVLSLSSNKKTTIQNAATGAFAQPLSKDYEEGDSVYSQSESYEWVIRRVPKMQDTYQILSVQNIKLLWSFQSNQPGEKLTFVRAGTDPTPTYWNIKKQTDVPALGGNQGKNPTPIDGATRPDDRGVQGNTIEITIPKGWTVLVTAMAFSNAINSIFLRSAANGLVDSFQFYNQRSAEVISPMSIKDRQEVTYNASADKGPIALGFTFWGSTDPKKKDPLSLHENSANASQLKSSKFDRSGDAKNYPDFRTYNIMATDGAGNNRAIVTVQMSNKNDPGNEKPTPPNPDEVNGGYNPECDEARPDCLDQYLSKYDCVFLVDDSGSMEGQRWTEARQALIGIANEAVQFDGDGIGLVFLNSTLRSNNIKGEDEILPILNQVSASGGTPTGARLDVVLGEHIGKLDAAVGKPAYGAIKPFDLIVITDGEPTDEPLPILEKWAAHLDTRKHHPNAVGVQFVQIGDVATATTALLALTRGKVRGMVDTIPYTGSFTLEKLTRVLLGAIMPSIRAKQNAKLSK